MPPIAWENTPFEPDSISKFIRAKLEITEQRPAAVGVSAQTRHVGLFLIDLFQKANDAEDQGPATLDALAEVIQAQFQSGITLTDGAVTVIIKYAERSGGNYDAPWYHVPITVEFYSYT